MGGGAVSCISSRASSSSAARSSSFPCIKHDALSAYHRVPHRQPSTTNSRCCLWHLTILPARRSILRCPECGTATQQRNTSATQRLTTPTRSHITTCHDVRAAWRSQRGAGGSGEEQTMLTFATSSGSSSSTSSWPCFSSAAGAGGALQEGRSMARVHPRQHTQLAHRPHSPSAPPAAVALASTVAAWRGSALAAWV